MDDIFNRMIFILKKYYNYQGIIDYNIIKEKPMTSKYFKFDAIELYYFLMLLEDEFNIYFYPNELRGYEFFTLSNIQKLIKSKKSDDILD